MTTQNPANRPRALIAMSGGVDSSVAACLMQQAGYDCTGITMRLTHNETLGQSGYQTCCSEKDIEDAAEVAFALDMPYQVLDFTADFRAQIIEKFIRVYEAGGTPNPCIDCNKYMKFRHLLDWAEEHGMEYVVTGHYARVEQDAATGRWLLKKGLDEGKDQSYVLYNLTQEQLAHIRLPLGALHKTEVRKIAQEHSFINAQKHDSQDICFVPDGDYARFMEQFTGKHYPAGDFLDRSGKVVGTHSGAVRYTLGQRKGLGLALGAPVYVCGKDMQANTVTVGPESELFDRIVPRDAAVVDLGCGYGPLSYMLAMLCERRRVVGMDYDAEKVETAGQSFLRRPGIEFIHADLRTAELPGADAFLLVDVLHYMRPEEQRALIGRCAARLNAGGRIIIRDGDSGKAERHKATAMTEVWSTKIVGFNKTDGGLHFTSTPELARIARELGMEIHAAHKDTRTSNTVYILTRRETEGRKEE